MRVSVAVALFTEERRSEPPATGPLRKAAWTDGARAGTPKALLRSSAARRHWQQDLPLSLRPAAPTVPAGFHLDLVMLRQFFNRNFSPKPYPGFFSFYNQELIW